MDDDDDDDERDAQRASTSFLKRKETRQRGIDTRSSDRYRVVKPGMEGAIREGGVGSSVSVVTVCDNE